jgi:2-polyprenyl-3-methyl-5-hydroxy-6-metoxy-1,4-benzoquinol methylase
VEKPPSEKNFKIRKYFNNDRLEMLKFVPSGVKRVLEVGCGFGFFSALVSTKREAEVWGIEPNAEAAEEAKKRLHRVFLGTFEENANEIPCGYFDAVILNDVLEHVANTEFFLTLVKTALKQGGVVVISLPNIRYFHTMYDLLIKKDFEYVDSGVLDRTHLRFFTKKSAVRTFEKSGFRVIDICGINPTRSVRFKVFNLLFMNLLSDMQYLQYAFLLTQEDVS